METKNLILIGGLGALAAALWYLSRRPSPPCQTCEVSCQTCQVGCESICEEGCEVSCQVSCDISCEPNIEPTPSQTTLTIFSEGPGTTNPPPGNYYHDPTDIVEVLAIPALGTHLKEWVHTTSEGEVAYPPPFINPLPVTVYTDITLIARFEVD